MPAIRFLSRLIVGALIAFPAAAQTGRLYKHTDEKGNVVFSDRPSTAEQAPEKKKSSNAASREASRQYEIERSELLQRRREEEFRARQFREAQERAAREARSGPPGRGYSGRFDPNLPDSPPPSSERRYYYDGR